MQKTNLNVTFHRKPILFILFFCIGFLFAGCASSSELKVAEFKFSFEGQEYLLRSSYCPNNPQSCNQLYGKDLIATDLNQDRTIDKITKGNISLESAQRIYDYCLEILENQGKVSTISNNEKVYSMSEDNFIYEVKTLIINGNSYQNEFVIKEKRGYSQFGISIFQDSNADGELDLTLKGVYPIGKAKIKYQSLINKGLVKNRITAINGLFLVE